MPPMATYQFTCEVEPQYLSEQSSPDEDLYAFAYTITITNTGDVTAQLISRHWVIDDAQGKTLASASTLEKDVRGTTGATIDAATSVGTRVAEAAKAAGVTQVVFDRGGFLFHGRVKALAEAARAAGLEF